MARQDACDDEQQIRQAIEIAHHLRRDRLRACERPAASLRPAADGTREVTSRGSRTSARKNELLQAWQFFIELIEIPFQAFDLGIAHRTMARDAEFTTEIEQVMLYFQQAGAHPFRDALDGEYNSQCAIDLVPGSI